jgi:ribosomal protein L3
LVNGSVPGNKGNVVKVQKAVKVKQWLYLLAL